MRQTALAHRARRTAHPPPLDTLKPSPTIPPPPPLAYTWGDMAAALGVSVSTLRHLVRTGQIPGPVFFAGRGEGGRGVQLFVASVVQERLVEMAAAMPKQHRSRAAEQQSSRWSRGREGGVSEGAAGACGGSTRGAAR